MLGGDDNLTGERGTCRNFGGNYIHWQPLSGHWQSEIENTLQTEQTCLNLPCHGAALPVHALTMCSLAYAVAVP